MGKDITFLSVMSFGAFLLYPGLCELKIIHIDEIITVL